MERVPVLPPQQSAPVQEESSPVEENDRGSAPSHGLRAIALYDYQAGEC